MDDFPVADTRPAHPGKRIEEITTVWNKLVIDRGPEMEEWIPEMQELLKRRLTIYGYFNNHFSGSGYMSARVFSEMWERIAARKIPEIARLAHAREQNLRIL